MPSTTRKPEFPTPFEGRPSRLLMFGPFCLSPEAYLKLFGVSIKAAHEARGLGNHYRRLLRWKRSPAKNPVMARTMHEMLDAADISHAPAAALSVHSDLRDALSGDTGAQERVGAMGAIELLLWGMGYAREDWEHRHRFLVLLEAASLRTGGLLDAGDMPGAAAFMAGHPLLRALLWPEALESMRSARYAKLVFPITLAMMLDAHLGWLAALDLDVCAQMELPLPQFAKLLPSHTKPGRNPTSLLFDALKERLGVTSAAAVLAEGMPPADVSSETVYHWSAGMNFPDEETVEKLLQAHGIQDEPDVFHRQFAATRLINLMGYISEDLITRARTDGEPPCRWPWPDFPFGYPDFASWAAVRYPFWLDYLRENEAALTAEVNATPHAEA
jgi:hypothetical protein